MHTLFLLSLMMDSSQEWMTLVKAVWKQAVVLHLELPLWFCGNVG